MTRDFLKSAVEGITDEQITAILNENGKDLTESKNALALKEQELATIKTERDGLKTQIASRDADIKDLQSKVKGNEGLEQQLKDLQGKYDKDTADLKTTLSEQAISHATEKFFTGVEFSSTLAKNAAMSQFKEQGFKLDEKTGEFVGGKDWLENLKKTEPAAFKVEKPNNNDGDPNNNQGFFPHFTNPNGTQNQDGANGGKSNPFSFNFAGVRAHDQTK